MTRRPMFTPPREIENRDHAFAVVAGFVIPTLMDCGLWDDSHCVWATSTVIECANRFGVDAEPLPVSVIAGCEKFSRWRRLVNSGVMTPEPEDARAVVCRSRQKGDPLPPGEEWWAGHLVARVGDRFILDANSVQFSREDMGVHLPNAIVFGFDTKDDLDRWKSGSHALEQHFESSIMILVHEPLNTGYEDGPDWEGRDAMAAADLAEDAIAKGMEILGFQ
jgi:hypothetical protein